MLVEIEHFVNCAPHHRPDTRTWKDIKVDVFDQPNASTSLHGYRESIIIEDAMAIHSFGDPATADLYHGRNTSRVRRFPQDMVVIALRKFDIINAAHRLDDLSSPPSNRLEALKGDLAGFHSIRVNRQWRIIFRWENGAHEVSLTDYH